MEYESTDVKPVFKTATMRNLFTKEVMVAFEACQNHAELICLYQEFEPKFKEMENGHEYDRMAFDIIHARYRALHVRHDEDREYIRRAVEAWQEQQLME